MTLSNQPAKIGDARKQYIAFSQCQKMILIAWVSSCSNGMIVNNSGTTGATVATRSQTTSSVAKGIARISRTTVVSHAMWRNSSQIIWRKQGSF
jgi:hypothetical protein